MKDGRLAAAIALAALLAGAPPAAAALDDADAKARIVLGLLRFTQWPDPVWRSTPGVLRLCVVHRNRRVAAALAVFDGTPIHGRRLIVASNPPRSGNCQALYLDAGLAEVPPLPEVGAPVLTLTDAAGFLERGGMVQIVAGDDAVRFDIDRSALRTAGLSVAPAALALARLARP